jgi:hypothetical protein
MLHFFNPHLVAWQNGNKRVLHTILLLNFQSMTEEIRMKYVVQKVTKGKHVFKVHKNLFGFVLDNISSQLLYVVGENINFVFCFLLQMS